MYVGAIGLNTAHSLWCGRAYTPITGYVCVWLRVPSVCMSAYGIIANHQPTPAVWCEA